VVGFLWLYPPFPASCPLKSTMTRRGLHRVAGGSRPPSAPTEFPALRSSKVASQRGESLQLPVGEILLWSQQRELLLDPLELLPVDRAMPAPTAQHFASITPTARCTRCNARKFPPMP